MRILVLVLLVASAIVMGLVLQQAGDTPPVDAGRFAWIATADQLGVVGYRDPVGVVSPDGAFLAYSEGRRVRVVPVAGGASRPMAEGEGQIRHLSWAEGQPLLAEDTLADRRWWLFDLDGAGKRPLWEGRDELEAAGSEGEPARVAVDGLRQLVWSPAGDEIAGAANGREGPEVWRVAADGSRAERVAVGSRPAAPAFTPGGELACITRREGRSHLSIPCGSDPLALAPDVDVVGPLAFSPGGDEVYFASPGEAGMVDLWAATISAGRARRLTSFSRDSYAPSVTRNGRVVFKVQSYRTLLADVDAAGGPTRQLATFQAETPSWHPTRPLVAFTFGTWRRVLDDVNYPDIAQEIGVIDIGAGGVATEPAEVVADSDSEDQAMAWSPNGQWIALHTHREQSDDVWLRPVDGSRPDRRITFLGRGAEVGWPRWSPDGRTVLLDGARPADGRSVIFVIGVDQETGEVTSELREVVVEGVEADLTHAEWLPDSQSVIAVGREGPGRHVILTVPVSGGVPRIVHRFATEHDFPGLGVSPDGREVTFVAPAPDGYHQIFAMPVAGGPPRQVTVDRSHKTQPAWSPDGRRIAFTIWSYQAQFWAMD